MKTCDIVKRAAAAVQSCKTNGGGRWGKFILLSVTLIFLYAGQAQAQVGALMTVGAVDDALKDALTQLQSTISVAGSEAKGVGDSIQANAQNVLVDMNNTFKDRLTQIDKITDAQQKQLASNARELVGLTRQATLELEQKGFKGAKETLYETDILAYNTTYSLPCRSQEPRVVYSIPDRTTLTGDEVWVTVKGNFLNFGPDPVVTVDGHAAKFVRNDSEIQVLVPTAVVQSTQTTRTLPILIDKLTSRIRKANIVSVALGCGESLEFAHSEGVTVQVRPRVSYAIETTIGGDNLTWSAPYTALNQHVYEDTQGDCGQNRDVSHNFCLQADERVVTAAVANQSTAGHSNIGPWTRSGERCVLVPARVIGLGFNSDPVFHHHVSCRGGGNINYDMVITGQRQANVQISEQTFSTVTTPGQSSVTYSYKDVPTDGDLTWKYTMKVTAKRGSTVLFSDSLSDARGDSDNGVHATLSNGTLTVVLPGEQPWNSD